MNDDAKNDRIAGSKNVRVAGFDTPMTAQAQRSFIRALAPHALNDRLDSASL